MVTRHQRGLAFGLSMWLSAVGTGLWVLLPPGTPAETARWGVAAVLLVPAFVAIEWWPLTVQHRGESMHLTLSGVVVLVGLFFVGPLPTLAARLLGSLLGLWVRWRNSPVKLAVNGAAMVLEIWVSAALVALIPSAAAVSAPDAWGIVGLAALAGELTMSACVLAAVRLTVGPLRASALLPLGIGVAASAALVTVFTVLAINLVAVDPRLVVVVAATMALLVVSNRRRHELDMRHQRLRSLYRFLTTVERATDLQVLLTSVLREANEVLGTLSASLLLIEDGGGAAGQAVHVRLSGADLDVAIAPRDAVADLIQDAGGGVMLGGRHSDAAVSVLGLPEGPGIAASLAHADVSGVLVVHGRRSGLPVLDTDDLAMATAVAAHAGSALAEARLLERLREERKRIEELGLVDRTTGLPNHAGLLRAAPHLPSGAVLVLGLRGLDRVALWLGHAVAERVVQVVADRLREFAPARGLEVAAIGSTTFALVDDGTRDVRDGTTLSQGLIDAVSGPVEEGPVSIDVVPTVGLALAPSHGTDVAELLREAGNALEQAVDKGLQVCWFDADYDREVHRRLQMASDLRVALGRGDITVAYQPKVDLRTGRVIGVEALARWHDGVNHVPPQEFVDIAERVGLIRELTMHIADQALQDARRWWEEGLGLSVAVNLSLSLSSDASVARDITAIVAGSGVPADRVVVEITESQVMDDVRLGRGVLGVFTDAGIQLSVDDFGTGYSSMSSLKTLPVQELKIDRSFVTNLAHDDTDRAIVTAVVRLGSELGLAVVAEGVEDDESRRVLVGLGCDTGQGYLFSRPVPGEAVPHAVRLIDLDRAVVDPAPAAVQDPPGDRSPDRGV